MEALYDYIREGIILCSKTDSYKKGEKPSKYFLNLEKGSKSKSHLRKILTSGGQETTNKTMILDNIRSYYSSQYKRQSNKSESDCFSYHTNLNLPKLSKDEQNLCEGKLTRRECWEALLSMGNNKSPGNDGLSKEFYICFFDEIITYLLDALNLAFDQGQLSNSQHQAMITLRTTMPLVAYIRNSLRFWYYASFSTCCQNLEKKLVSPGKFGRKWRSNF